MVGDFHIDVVANNVNKSKIFVEDKDGNLISVEKGVTGFKIEGDAEDGYCTLTLKILPESIKLTYFPKELVEIFPKSMMDI